MELKRKIFLSLSIVIIIVDGLFVFINYLSAKQSLAETVRQNGVQLEMSFNIALSSTLETMMQISSFIASDSYIKGLFLQGKNAIENDNEEQATAIRQRLYEYVSPSWTEMTTKYSARQLHFHLGPGSLSFLRVHKPNKFGDRMDDIRYTIVDTNREKTPRTGIETGRVYTGLRGVSPVIALDGITYIGALEAGASFEAAINPLKQKIGADIAVLLDKKHVSEKMWEESAREHFIEIETDCPCYLEATTNPVINDILAIIGLQEKQNTMLVKVAGRHLAVTRVPLRDYRGTKQPELPSIGAVVLWRDASDLIASFEKNIWVNVIYGFVGFFIIELLIFIGINMATRQLTRIVNQKNREVLTLNKQLESLADTDPLTQIGNRRYFINRLKEEISRHRRSNLNLCLLIGDLDHFKEINDTFGHVAGDMVLKEVAKRLQSTVRISDIVCRFGGEEFCITLPSTDMAELRGISEKLCNIISSTKIDLNNESSCSITISFGGAEFKKEQGLSDFINTADSALYEAKKTGRNRVVLYSNNRGCR